MRGSAPSSAEQPKMLTSGYRILISARATCPTRPNRRNWCYAHPRAHGTALGRLQRTRARLQQRRESEASLLPSVRSRTRQETSLAMRTGPTSRRRSGATASTTTGSARPNSVAPTRIGTSALHPFKLLGSLTTNVTVYTCDAMPSCSWRGEAPSCLRRTSSARTPRHG